MALGVLKALIIAVFACFVLTSIITFAVKNAKVQIISFCFLIIIGLALTFAVSTSFPSNYESRKMLTWLGVIPTVIGIIIALIKKKLTTEAKVFVIITFLWSFCIYLLTV